MKIKVPFEYNKYTCGTTCVLEDEIVEVLKTDRIGQYPIIIYIPSEDKIGCVGRDGITMNDKQLYALINAPQNFCVNLYQNIITGHFSNGNGRYVSIEEAKKNINIPQNCIYHSTIECL
ncbi:MAG: hypothetical protein RSE41_04195 [Clostridia bacterium]